MLQATDDFENPRSLPAVRECWKSEHLAQMVTDMDPSLAQNQHLSHFLPSTLLPYEQTNAEKQNAAKQTTLTKLVSSPAAGSSESSVSFPSPLAVLDMILTTTTIHLIRVKLTDTTTTTHLPEPTHLPLLRKLKTFICKPDSECQGRGIFLTQNIRDIQPGEDMICQVYILKVLYCTLDSLPRTLTLFNCILASLLPLLFSSPPAHAPPPYLSPTVHCPSCQIPPSSALCLFHLSPPSFFLHPLPPPSPHPPFSSPGLTDRACGRDKEPTTYRHRRKPLALPARKLRDDVAAAARSQTSDAVTQARRAGARIPEGLSARLSCCFVLGLSLAGQSR
ncbi:uncharacterized protein LOC132402398 [Hypanus sabinus]|uniref:uncharacterized protein LOC132402398 n=1 Tax=Hypanus sabinus TaxID=79690 RepID=UPI0028C3C482|nr:uncharacterized protein LOC132402398 [Hypanus sabinus]